MNKKESGSIIPLEQVEGIIYIIRGSKVMLDRDLAVLYGTETKKLIQSVKRNIERFPEDFMFQLTEDEWNILRSQFVTSNKARGGRRYLPFAFTEQGVAMLSSVLRSPQAIKVNIEIMRAFIRLRQALASHKELAKDLQEIKEFVLRNSNKNNREFQRIWKAIEKLTEKPNQRKIGFDLN